MKLIIILLALAVERFTHVGAILKRFNWFGCYVNFLRRKLSATSCWQSYMGVFSVLFPVLLIVGLLYYLLGHLVYGIVGFIIALVVLLYCLGPEDFYDKLQEYFTATETAESSEAAEKSSSTEEAETSDEKASDVSQSSEKAKSFTITGRELTKSIFLQFNERIFAVLFWFIVLGPLGAILYRMTELLAKSAESESHVDTAIYTSAADFQKILDWIPIRLLGLGYALVGDFSNSFSVWLKNVASGIDYNQIFLEQTGLAALKVADENGEEEKGKQADITENKAALALTDRALIVYLVIVALFVLGAWIY